jgi:AcrR family transcriptional regulator
VLDAAEQLFRELGWGPTTITAIANKAGVSAETIYARFGNKKAIAHQLIIRAMRGDQPDVPMMEQSVRPKLAGMETAGEIIDAFAVDISILLGRVAPILAVIRTAAESDAEMSALYRELHQSRRRNLAVVAVALQQIGALRPGLDIETATDTIWSIVSPELWLLRESQLPSAPEANRDWVRASLRRLLMDEG